MEWVHVATFGAGHRYGGRRLFYMDGVFHVEGVGAVTQDALSAVVGDPSLTWRDSATQDWAVQHFALSIRRGRRRRPSKSVWAGFKTRWLWAALAAAVASSLVIDLMVPLAAAITEGARSSVMDAGNSGDIAGMYGAVMTQGLWLGVLQLIAAAPVVAVLLGWSRAVIAETTSEVEWRQSGMLLAEALKVTVALIAWIMPGLLLVNLMAQFAGATEAATMMSTDLETARTYADAGLGINLALGAVVFALTIAVAALFPVGLARFLTTSRVRDLFAPRLAVRTAKSMPGYLSFALSTVAVFVAANIAHSVMSAIVPGLGSFAVNIVFPLVYGSILAMYVTTSGLNRSAHLSER